ncbi:uncharacterized protein LOC143658317 [Tamandua tetradactyla]|uniref:uncharacterized protein LOC143658317 n=1 Tax=Tamandua tetradactyla TaxID=48850 RepID=UPI0040549037
MPEVAPVTTGEEQRRRGESGRRLPPRPCTAASPGWGGLGPSAPSAGSRSFPRGHGLPSLSGTYQVFVPSPFAPSFKRGAPAHLGKQEDIDGAAQPPEPPQHQPRGGDGPQCAQRGPHGLHRSPSQSSPAPPPGGASGACICSPCGPAALSRVRTAGGAAAPPPGAPPYSNPPAPPTWMSPASFTSARSPGLGKGTRSY